MIDFNYSESEFDGILLQDIAEDSDLSIVEGFTDTETSSFYPIFDSFELLTGQKPIFQIKSERSTIKKAGQNSPEKKVGQILQSEREKKVTRYLEKKRKRTWHKKISYSCRKMVADQRVRIKGRFVTKEQAICIKNQLSK